MNFVRDNNPVFRWVPWENRHLVGICIQKVGWGASLGRVHVGETRKESCGEVFHPRCGPNKSLSQSLGDWMAFQRCLSLRPRAQWFMPSRPSSPLGGGPTLGQAVLAVSPRRASSSGNRWMAQSQREIWAPKHLAHCSAGTRFGPTCWIRVAPQRRGAERQRIRGKEIGLIQTWVIFPLAVQLGSAFICPRPVSPSLATRYFSFNTGQVADVLGYPGMGSRLNALWPGTKASAFGCLGDQPCCAPATKASQDLLFFCWVQKGLVASPATETATRCTFSQLGPDNVLHQVYIFVNFSGSSQREIIEKNYVVPHSASAGSVTR